MFKKACLLSVFFILILPQSAHALSQNKVITKNYKWKIRPVRHFDIYYYGGQGKALLPYTEKYLQRAFDRAKKVMPESPKESLPFFQYNNHNEFEQTNITDIGEGTGGVTEAFKNRFLLSFNGSQRQFEYIIAHEYMHEVQFEYLFSGFWRSIRLIKFILYPNWLMEGLAEYSGGDLDATTREMYVRDAATSKKLLPLEQLHSFNHVLPHQVTLAYKESEAFIRYIVEEYGEDKLPMLFVSYRERYDANSVLTDVLGADVNSIDRRFREYLEEKYERASRGLSEPSAYGRKITRKGRVPRFNTGAAFSPDGRSVAYISDETGMNEIYVQDVKTGKRKNLWDIDDTMKVENVNTEGRGLSFSPDGRYLAFCGEKLQKDRIFAYDIKKNRIEKYGQETETCSSPVFSKDGGKIFFSGIKGGFRDLFYYDIPSGKTERLTFTDTDEIDAEVSPDGKTLVFAAERENPDGRMEYDLCLLDLETKEKKFLTALKGDERNPCFAPDGGTVYFISDTDGIFDVYRTDAGGSRVDKLTSVIGGNFQPVVSPDGRYILFSSFRNGERHLYIAEVKDLQPVAGAPAGGGGGTAAKEEPEEKDDRDDEYAPYRFRASTDLFFPAVFYSSLDGLFLATYWQVSDMLGNHRMQSVVSYASEFDYVDYDLVYGFVRYRTQVYFGFSGEEYREDFEDPDFSRIRKDHQQAVAVLYPLNRFQSVGLSLATIDRREEIILEETARYRRRENIAGVQFRHDTVRGPYLEPLEGTRLAAATEFSEKVLYGDYNYQNYFLDAARYFPVSGASAVGFRMFGGASKGEDSGAFRLGGVDRVRGVPSDTRFIGNRIFVANLELRFPIVYNINYHMWYMFPDFFFKSFYSSLFVDAGFVCDETELSHVTPEYWRGSYGTSFRFHTFILQMYPLLLNFQLAQRMDSPGWVFYFSLGSTF
ncbi:MAG: PD40 domain-containing protein [Endomicrobiales bacterium]|nr:PD40 domain-containing protein [Endomicrobiales bacterium]